MTVHPPQPDTTISNRYQILRPLGQGGMGAVYLARDTRFSGRYVALKENGERSPAAQAQFQLEANVLAALQHPRLPAVTDHFVTQDGRQFLVMNYVEGENLEERVTRLGPLPEAHVLAWAGQVLDALAYLHTQSPPVIHRDVKPSNIRITPDGQAVLVDFGVAKYMVAGRATATVARAGSPGYAPIEQYAGGTDQRSDVYSLGGTLYFALTGHAPPDAPLLAAGQTLPSPRRLNPNISRRVEAIVIKAMQSDANARFQSAGEMQTALQARRASSKGRAGAKSGIPPISRSNITRKQKATVKALGVTATLTLCAVISMISFAYYDQWRDKPTPTPAPTLTPETIIPATATATPEVLPTPETPTPTSQSGQATSTPMPTNTPTNTPLPDDDGDGIPDYNDTCRGVPGLQQFDGCPDNDADGIPDPPDTCPETPGQNWLEYPEYNGCPDQDGDGVPDPLDTCPDWTGPPENNGCPTRDGDDDNGGSEPGPTKPPGRD